jgi:GNAT superfamily N-acetyltransferase
MMDSESPARDQVLVRNLRPEDHDAVVAIDAKLVGRRRDEFFRIKMKQAFADTGIAVSLAAEIDRMLVGFLLARVYYGEFGVSEPVAVLDVLGVPHEFRGRGVGAGLIDQLRTNLLGLGIRTLQTEVAWDSFDLLAFFKNQGFQPAPRFCLDLDLERTRS